MKSVEFFKETVTVGEGVEDVVVIFHEAFTVAVELTARASHDSGKDRAKDRFGCEVHYEAFGVADANMLL